MSFNIVFMGSGSGTTIEYLIRRLQDEGYSDSISAVLTNNKESGLVEKMKEYNVDMKTMSSDPDSEELLAELDNYNPNLVVLGGYLKKIQPEVIEKYTLINSHPSLLPKYGGEGMYGSSVHKAVLDNKETKTGITIHKVSEEYDEGMYLAQTEVSVQEGDTVETLEERVKEVEKPFYYDTIVKIMKGEIKI